MDKAPGVATVSDVIVDRRTGRASWAVVAAYVLSPQGDPVCIDYRARQVASDGTDAEAIVEAIALAERMELHCDDPQLGVPGGPLVRGIPRYVFEQASQGRLLERARARLALLDAQLARDAAARERGEDVRVRRRTVPPAERALLTAARPRKAGRPPQRSLLEKLLILEAVERASADGRVLADVASEFHMSRSALRDLLSWARRDANPRLFTARGQGRGGGELTPEGRDMLEQLRVGEEGQD